MVQVYADDVLIYTPNLEEHELMYLSAMTSLTKGGTAELTLPPDHPAFGVFTSFKTVITIYRDGQLLFRGRALYPTDDFYNCRTITCEGERCFLRDGLLQPYLYQTDPASIFRDIIGHYNAQVDPFKRFIVGDITVTDPNNYIRMESESAKQVSEAIDSLVERVGGYITFTTNEDGKRVINWLASLDQQSNQVIEFGENLLDFSRSGANSDPATVIYPYGAKDETTGQRVTIDSVNDGKGYVLDEEAVAIRGFIAQAAYWDDVTLPKNLLARAKKYLETSKLIITSLELSAVDLSLMDKSIDSFKVGDMVRVVSAPHAIDDVFLLTERKYDFLEPANDTIVLGKSLATLTGLDVTGDKNALAQLQRMRENLVLDFDTQISSSEEAIRADYEAKIESMTEGLEADYAAQLEAAKKALQADIDSAISEAEDELQATVDTQVSQAKTELSGTIDSKVSTVRVEMQTDIDNAVSAAKSELETDIDNAVSAAKSDIKSDYETAIGNMKSSIESDFTNDLSAVETALRDEYGELVAGILDGSTPAGGVKTVSATVDGAGYHLTSEGSVDFQTDDFNVKNAAGRNLFRVTAENTSTGDPGGQVELGEDGYPVRFAQSFVLPPENGGTGYDFGQTHRITSEPLDTFGEDGDLAVYYNGSTVYYDDIVPTVGSASTGSLFGLNRSWNRQTSVSGYARVGNSSAGNFGMWWQFKTPADASMTTVTLKAKSGKVINNTWYGWNVKVALTVGLFSATSSTTALAKATFTPSNTVSEFAVSLVPASALAANTTYYIAIYDTANSDTKSLAQVDLSSGLLPGGSNDAQEGLFIKSYGEWKNLLQLRQVIKSGSVSASSSGVVVTFDEPFSETPHITASYSTEGSTFSGESGVLKIYNKSTNGFSIQIAGSFGSQEVDWIAVGK